MSGLPYERRRRWVLRGNMDLEFFASYKHSHVGTHFEQFRPIAFDLTKEICTLKGAEPEEEGLAMKKVA